MSSWLHWTGVWYWFLASGKTLNEESVHIIHFCNFTVASPLILNNYLVSSGKHGQWKIARHGWHVHTFTCFSVIGIAHGNSHSQNTCNNILPMLMVWFGNTSSSFAAWYSPLDNFSSLLLCGYDDKFGKHICSILRESPTRFYCETVLEAVKRMMKHRRKSDLYESRIS